MKKVIDLACPVKIRWIVQLTSAHLYMWHSVIFAVFVVRIFCIIDKRVQLNTSGLVEASEKCGLHRQ